MTGRLVLVATPIGNLGDLSPRAVEALAAADVLACEDTRRTRKLLSHAGVAAPPMVVVNDHSEQQRCDALVARMLEGETVTLVSDAGLPGVSDPGQQLVRAAVDAGLVVEVIPGPSAALTALVLSGLPSGRFCFEGFLPRRGSGRTARLAELADEARTTVFYEAPHRLARTLTDLAEAFGPDRPVAVARELTKLHEQVWRGDLGGAARWAAEGVRGELVIVVGGAPAPGPPDDNAVVEAVRAGLAHGESRRDVARAVADQLGVGRRRVYELINELDD